MSLRRRTFARWVAFALCACLAAACASTSAPAGPEISKSAWTVAPAFERGLPDGRRFHVTVEDPAKSGAGAQLAGAFSAALSAKGYESAPNAQDANFLCVIAVRYFGRTEAPNGEEELLTKAGETIQGGDESWLATDGSGFDTKTRKPKAIKFRARVRSKFGEFFRGREDDEWTVLLDVAIGTRSSDQPQMVQRHEGRVWASSIAGEQDRAAATERLLAELGKRWSEALP